MKKTLLIVLFFLSSFSSFGQKIHFGDSTNVWTFFDARVDHGTWFGTSYALFDGDTVLNGKKWRTYGACAYYEDTIAGKVFFMTLPDTTDIFLLYDYSLAPGDTIVNRTNELGGIIASYNKVVSVDATLVNGLWYKMWKFNGYESADYTTIIDTFIIIEGIGCVEGLHYPCNPLGRSPVVSTQLECFENNGSSYPLSNPVWEIGLLGNFYFDNDSSCRLNLGAAKLSRGMGKATVMPDPINETSKLVFPYNITSGLLVVCNDLGQPAINLPFKNKDEILIGDEIKIPGVYYYKVTDNEHGTVYSGKFLKR